MTAPSRSDSRLRAVLLTVAGAVIASGTLAACSPTPATPTPSAAPSTAAPSTAPSTAPSASPAESPATGCRDRYPGKLDLGLFARTPNPEQAICFNPPPPTPDEPTSDPIVLPSPCLKAAHSSNDLIADRRGFVFLFDADPAPDATDTSAAAQTVTRYSGSGAADYLKELRAAVAACGPYHRDHFTYDYRLADAPKVGDESLRLLVTAVADGPLEGGQPAKATFPVSVVRKGDLVSVVFDLGWEGYPTRTKHIEGFFADAAHLR
ncbi:hypothetical protein QEZ54_24665 [Catellatospora sp. KI3]|uniref:hypothetical protein n=1 Tax=Catellatospora sp. KI3 TaxID=3041620 RepID=UPI002482CA7E|nr:hypothetical protein [Catellatospora sp. KI3]MDI1464176.1 hypothetical protein [Catellatospora sp. KI3]